MKMGVKITARQIRFLLTDRKRAWMIQPLHVPQGVPQELQGIYTPPLDEERGHCWGQLNGNTELDILRKWVELGYKE